MGRKSYLDKYQPYIDYIMNDLGLTGKIIIDFQFGHWESMGGDSILYKTAYAGKRYGMVRIDITTHDYMLTTLAHELMHIQQYYQERLEPPIRDFYKTKRGTTKYAWFITWKNEKYLLHNNSKNTKKNNIYLNQPWEQEAIAYESEIMPRLQSLVFVGTIGKTTFYKMKGTEK